MIMIHKANQGPQNQFDDDDFSVPPHNHRRAYQLGYYDDDDNDDCSVGGGVWLGGQSSAGDAENQTPRGHTFTAFDRNGVGHCRVTSESQPFSQVATKPSITGKSNGLIFHNFQPKTGERVIYGQKGSKFAKVPVGAHGRKLRQVTLELIQGRQQIPRKRYRASQSLWGECYRMMTTTTTMRAKEILEMRTTCEACRRERYLS
jgi:hypothetical protein